ncbi:hypothetical protein [Rufibacter psychrotolerans]|uniref:hypothetical protein n=1 Tax=Rufibacter psychrotolerans TaxID=2812556 RepID=UPI0019686A61|nr:hypothetical protein [Rufibacter sp. SYSU D00308]
MAKRLLPVLCLLFALSHANGQDTITRTDGTTLKATVVEVTPAFIKFRLFQQLDTLLYQISTLDVQTLVLADGTTRSFAAAPASKEAPAKSQQQAAFNYETQYGRHLFWVSPLDLVYSNLTIAYEYILAKGKMGLKIPFNFSVTPPSRVQSLDSFRENNRYGLGLELNYYPHGQGRYRFFMGPALQYRVFRSYYYEFPGGTYEQKAADATMLLVAAKIGLYYQPTRRQLVAADAGVGYRYFRLPEQMQRNGFEISNRVYLPLNLHVGFRF